MFRRKTVPPIIDIEVVNTSSFNSSISLLITAYDSYTHQSVEPIEDGDHTDSAIRENMRRRDGQRLQDKRFVKSLEWSYLSQRTAAEDQRQYPVRYFWTITCDNFPFGGILLQRDTLGHATQSDPGRHLDIVASMQPQLNC
jgi:hypothetical protein